MSYPEACRSNTEIPNALDAQRIRERIVQAQEYIASLDFQIASLKKKRASRLEDIDTLRVAIAPHKKLSTDILHEIFSHFSSDDDTPNIHLPPEFPYEGPWILRQICSWWRQVALSHRGLWRSASLTDNSTHSWNSILDMAREILPIQGTVSLVFSINEDNFNISLDRLIKPNIGRIRSLGLDADFAIWDKFCELDRTKFLSLRTLSIVDDWNEDFGPWEDQGFIPLDIYPLLQNVEIYLTESALRLPMLLKTDRASWSNITSLCIKKSPSHRDDLIEQMSAGLNHCVNLIFLGLHGISFPAGPPTTVILPKLETLELFAMSPENYRILDGLTLPSLSRLRIHAEIPGACPMRKLAQLVVRSRCSKTLTSIDNTQITSRMPPSNHDLLEEEFRLPTSATFDITSLKNLLSHLPVIKRLRLPLNIDPYRHLACMIEQGYLPDLQSLGFWSTREDLETFRQELFSLIGRLQGSGKWRWPDLHELVVITTALEQDGEVSVTVFNGITLKAVPAGGQLYDSANFELAQTY